ncbi:hypothetical protein PLA107_023010 [Pseudomonas amygdali pv. lachrymans str. M301315]|uniref:Uncharacterized protein n=1 Tax=Pseudomonas amygdali pv. lachrymans str. M301315 TaxID=629260 RepID=A0AAD0M1L8_PSEAV|nr:hypothetical protein PLA107_023010 [Pseudomonas amygdali pv. lachrymans str. M301315]
MTLINQGLQSVAGTKNRINQRLPRSLDFTVAMPGTDTRRKNVPSARKAMNPFGLFQQAGEGRKSAIHPCPT